MQITNLLERLLADVVHIRVFRILSLHKAGLTGRGLADLVQTSSFKISLVLRHLVAQGVVLETILGRAHIYRLNEEHIFTEKVISPLLHFERTLLNQLGSVFYKGLKPKPLSVLLYGSFARGEENADSDIDILFVYPPHYKTDLAAQQASSLAANITMRCGNLPQTRSISILDFKSRIREKDGLFRNILKEGESIAGLSLIDLLNYGGKKTKNSERS